MSHHQPLAGRAGIVTGGALGIGGGTARRLAADGANILIVDIVEDAAQRNAQQINDAGGTATYMVGDVAKEDITKSMVERCERRARTSRHIDPERLRRGCRT